MYSINKYIYNYIYIHTYIYKVVINLDLSHSMFSTLKELTFPSTTNDVDNVLQTFLPAKIRHIETFLKCRFLDS